MKWLWLLIVSLALTACDYTEVKREIGYKGRARMNPWLAAERFCEGYEGNVRSLVTWTEPTYDDAVWFVPASLLSNESFTGRLDKWVVDGGHLVILVDHSKPETNDWGQPPPHDEPNPALVEMLDTAGIKLHEPKSDGKNFTAQKIKFMGQSFKVKAESKSGVSQRDKKAGVFASAVRGDGRLTILTDGRLFRNRWIGEEQNADLLDSLILATDNIGNIGFTRGSSLSLWPLLAEHLWPVLFALGAVVFLWLWKNFSRFGPIEAANGVSTLRGYDHHLEALGDFQWRHDQATALIAPLRSRIVERAQRTFSASGHRDDDFFQYLANLAGLPRERVFRAMAENAPPDSAILTRTTADLQRLLQVLH